jgi:hypothetical protein
MFSLGVVCDCCKSAVPKANAWFCNSRVYQYCSQMYCGLAIAGQSEATMHSWRLCMCLHQGVLGI